MEFKSLFIVIALFPLVIRSQEEYCGGKPADVVFLLDASNSIWGPDFKKQLEFVQNIVSMFNIGENYTQVGMATFNRHVDLQFHLNSYHRKENLIEAIGLVEETYGDATNTADAVRFMRREMFSQRHGSRKGVPKVGVIITDGQSSNILRTVFQASRAKRQHINLFAIGVGDLVNVRELRGIASKPSMEYMFQVLGYGALGSVRNILAVRTCAVSGRPKKLTTPVFIRRTTTNSSSTNKQNGGLVNENKTRTTAPSLQQTSGFVENGRRVHNTSTSTKNQTATSSKNGNPIPTSDITISTTTKAGNIPISTTIPSLSTRTSIEQSSSDKSNVFGRIDPPTFPPFHNPNSKLEATEFTTGHSENTSPSGGVPIDPFDEEQSTVFPNSEDVRNADRLSVSGTHHTPKDQTEDSYSGDVNTDNSQNNNHDTFTANNNPNNNNNELTNLDNNNNKFRNIPNFNNRLTGVDNPNNKTNLNKNPDNIFRGVDNPNNRHTNVNNPNNNNDRFTDMDTRYKQNQFTDAGNPNSNNRFTDTDNLNKDPNKGFDNPNNRFRETGNSNNNDRFTNAGNSNNNNNRFTDAENQNNNNKFTGTYHPNSNNKFTNADNGHNNDRFPDADSLNNNQNNRFRGVNNPNNGFRNTHDPDNNNNQFTNVNNLNNNPNNRFRTIDNPSNNNGFTGTDNPNNNNNRFTDAENPNFNSRFTDAADNKFTGAYNPNNNTKFTNADNGNGNTRFKDADNLNNNQNNRGFDNPNNGFRDSNGPDNGNNRFTNVDNLNNNPNNNNRFTNADNSNSDNRFTDADNPNKQNRITNAENPNRNNKFTGKYNPNSDNGHNNGRYTDADHLNNNHNGRFPGVDNPNKRFRNTDDPDNNNNQFTDADNLSNNNRFTDTDNPNFNNNRFTGVDNLNNNPNNRFSGVDNLHGADNPNNNNNRFTDTDNPNFNNNQFEGVDNLNNNPNNRFSGVDNPSNNNGFTDANNPHNNNNQFTDTDNPNFNNNRFTGVDNLNNNPNNRFSGVDNPSNNNRFTDADNPRNNNNRFTDTDNLNFNSNRFEGVDNLNNNPNNRFSGVDNPSNNNRFTDANNPNNNNNPFTDADNSNFNNNQFNQNTNPNNRFRGVDNLRNSNSFTDANNPNNNNNGFTSAGNPNFNNNRFTGVDNLNSNPNSRFRGVDNNNNRFTDADNPNNNPNNRFRGGDDTGHNNRFTDADNPNNNNHFNRNGFTYNSNYPKGFPNSYNSNNQNRFPDSTIPFDEHRSPISKFQDKRNGFSDNDNSHKELPRCRDVSPSSSGATAGTEDPTSKGNDKPTALPHEGKEKTNTTDESHSGDEDKATTTTTTTPPPKPTERTMLEPACRNKEADIVFAIDSSNGINRNDYWQQIRFVREVARRMDIGENKTRVGLIVYTDQVMHQFDLSDHTNMKPLLEAIISSRRSAGGTRIDNAVRYVRTKSFRRSLSRPNAAQVAVFIAGSKSRNIHKTKKEAGDARSAGMTLFSIGVGKGYSKDEMHVISKGNKGWGRHGYFVNDFDKIETIIKDLTIQACRTKPTETPLTNLSCGFRQQADLMFVVDSANAGRTNTKKTLEFVRDVSKSVDIDKDNVHVGLMSAGCDAGQEGFSLGAHRNEKAMKDAISRNQRGTDISKLLKDMRRNSFSSKEGGRKDAKKVAVVVVDGQLEQPLKALREARFARIRGVEVYVVAVGNGKVQKEIEMMCDDPLQKHFFRVENYDQLKGLKTDLVDMFCDEL